MSVRTQTELSNERCDGCPPSLSPLRQSVAKGKTYRVRKHNFTHVPVVDLSGVPLMLTSGKRARKLIESHQATPFWSKGVFCIRLNREPSARSYQPVAVGVDPGSKREGISVVSKTSDILNLQLHARTGVKKKIENRRIMRRGRRYRNTPCRQPRWNRTSLKKDRIVPSTKARWGWKLRIIRSLAKVIPISYIVVEDIQAVTKEGQRKWNKSFSPLEVGKTWFYSKLEEIAPVSLKEGWETKELRDQYGLKKTSKKLAETFEAHCVDSWALAADRLDLDRQPMSKTLLCLAPLDFRRRSLHLQTPSKGNKRRRHGGTRTEGIRKGALVKSEKHGKCYLGGASQNRVSLHSLETGKRLTKSAKLGEENKVLGYNSIRFWKVNPE